MAAIERGAARVLLGVQIARPVDRRGQPPLERIVRWLRDPVTWKSLVFVALKFPLGIASFAIVACSGFASLVFLFAPLIVLITPVTVFGWIVESPLQGLPLTVVGVPAVLLSLHLYNGLAWLWALFARVMLGPSTVQLHERVDDLRDARARIIAAADAERRRIERDLHDGAQQRLVALSLTLGMAESRLAAGGAGAEAAAPLIAQARDEAQHAVKELRELASGIHPALLSERGLGPALEALAARAPVPTTVEGVPDQRLPAPIESACYFVTAEALTNVAKYAGATSASVSLAVEHGFVRLIVRDDGAGGANLNRGTGLRGLRDRVEALDGRLEVDSPPGLGTSVIAEIPIGGHG
jgi:signal transduction histidine kinase